MKKQEKAPADQNEHKLVRKWGKLNMRAGWVGFRLRIVSRSASAQRASCWVFLQIRIRRGSGTTMPSFEIIPIQGESFSGHPRKRTA